MKDSSSFFNYMKMEPLMFDEILNRAGLESRTPIPLDGDSATIPNFGQNDTNRSRNDKSAVEVSRL